MPPNANDVPALAAYVAPFASCGSPTSFSHGFGGWSRARAALLRFGLLVFDAELLLYSCW